MFKSFVTMSKADSVRPGTILFLSQPSGLYNACFGGIMATRTQNLGVEGVVVDGQVRDIEYIRSLNLPVSSPSLCFDCRLTILSDFRTRGLHHRCGSRMSAQVTTRSFVRRARLKFNCSAIDVPVRLSSVDQDIWVRPGDIIIGDADGIACLPRSLAARVIEMVPKLVSGDFSCGFIR